MKRLLRKCNIEFGIISLLSVYNIQYVTDICNRIILLERGKIIQEEKEVVIRIKIEPENYFEMQE
jgi:ABC-type methionine transport system ATPase subunit